MKFKLITILVLCLSIQACATIEVNSNGAKRDLLELRDESVIAYNSGKYNKALEGFTYLVKEVPEDAELWFKKANTHARLFQSKEAIESYETALLRDSNHFKAWRNLSVIQLRQAVNSLSQLMAVLPANHPLYNSSLLLANKTMAVLNTKPVLPNATTNKSVEDNRLSSTQSSVEQLLVEKAAIEKAAAEKAAAEKAAAEKAAAEKVAAEKDAAEKVAVEKAAVQPQIDLEKTERQTVIKK